MATTAVTTTTDKRTQLAQAVQKMEQQFAMALPEGVTPQRFVRVVITAVNTTPSLQRCSVESILGESLKAAQDGLLPDGREAALVPMAGVAKYMPMIRGILKKVHQSGEVKSLTAHVVRENDEWDYSLGDEEHIKHKPKLDGDRGKPIAVYAIARTKSEGVYRDVMSVADVEKVRAVSKAKNDGPWVTWWDEMARKTVVRRLSKYLPMSADLDRVIRRDDDLIDFSQMSAPTAPRVTQLHADFEDPEPQGSEQAQGGAGAAQDGPKPPAATPEPQTDKTGLAPGLKTGAQLAAEQEQDHQDAEFEPVSEGQGPEGAEQAPPAGSADLLGEFDVLAWAGQMMQGLPDYAGVDVLMADFKEHAAELKKKSPGIHKELAKACEARAQEIEKGTGS